MDIILEFYFVIVMIVLLMTGLLALNDDGPEEIENVWDWIVYGFLWIVQLIKAIFKFIIKLFR